jgi:hypothetical protein
MEVVCLHMVGWEPHRLEAEKRRLVLVAWRSSAGDACYKFSFSSPLHLHIWPSNPTRTTTRSTGPGIHRHTRESQPRTVPVPVTPELHIRLDELDVRLRMELDIPMQVLELDILMVEEDIQRVEEDIQAVEVDTQVWQELGILVLLVLDTPLRVLDTPLRVLDTLLRVLDILVQVSGKLVPVLECHTP